MCIDDQCSQQCILSIIIPLANRHDEPAFQLNLRVRKDINRQISSDRRAILQSNHDSCERLLVLQRHQQNNRCEDHE